MPTYALAATEIAELNLLSARRLLGGIWGEHRRYLDAVDEWARRVGSETTRLRHLFDREPQRFGNSLANFKMQGLVTVLQRDCGLLYDEALTRLPNEAFFRDSGNLFIHGLLEGKNTCSNLAPAFIAVGRRLGYPLKLVHASRHLFARWEEPRGPRFNIECAGRGFVSQSDEEIMAWKQTSEEECAKWGLMKSLDTKGEAATFASARGHCLMANGDPEKAAKSYSEAATLDAQRPAYVGLLVESLDAWKARQAAMLPAGFPPMRLKNLPPELSTLPFPVARDMAYLTARQHLLDDQRFESLWWRPLRQNPHSIPPDYPKFLTADFSERDWRELVVKHHDRLPDDFVVAPVVKGGGQ